MTNKLNTNLNNTKLKIIADLFKQHPEYVDLLKKNDLSTGSNIQRTICTDGVIEL